MITISIVFAVWVGLSALFLTLWCAAVRRIERLRRDVTGQAPRPCWPVMECDGDTIICGHCDVLWRPADRQCAERAS